jgi:hypothetical protein
MSKKLQRVFRDRRLTSDEVASEQAARQKIMEEFPPQVAPTPANPDSLSELLRRSIRDSGRPLEQIAKDAGISLNVVDAFVSGVRDIHMSTADQLARALGLEVTAD